MSKILFILLLLLAATIGGGTYYYLKEKKDYTDIYRTSVVERGDITEGVSASGTLNPVILVNVGSQVSGTIVRLHVDYNSEVKQGQILAEISPELLKAQLDLSKGNLNNAKAVLTLNEANAIRARELIKESFISQSDLDTAESNLATAKAQVQVQQANVDHDTTNLKYTIITSPIDGVIVNRNIDVGQTVAASFQTPTLFAIAQDLMRMQIITNVSEADVGILKIGQKAVFSVDSFRNRQYQGTLSQIRLNPTTVQNVVIYSVVVDVNNEDLSLLPGMTAFVNIIINQKKNVLKVPNGALQFKPSDKNAPKRDPKEKSVYVLTPDKKLTLVKVETGISDGKFTTISSGNLKEGNNVIVEELNTQKNKTTTNRLRF